ncbi:MAG: ABC transporter ATP-binding protein [Ekhidna sp.]
MLEIKSLIHTYGDTRLKYPDWEVAKGDHSLILGNSGCGKTTLLHLIGGLMKPSEGSILINNEDLVSKNGRSLDHFRGAHVGIIFQRPHLVRSLTVKENLALAQWLAKQKVDHNRIASVLEQLGILQLKNRKAHQLSQGQSQRVSIARAIINNPLLLLADEPTASLDDENCMKVVALLKEQAESTASTLVIATHDQRVKSEFENKLAL